MQCSPDLASQIQNKRPFSPMISPREKGEIVKKVAERISVGSNEENNSRKCLNCTWQFRHFLHKLAEWVGFEPTVPLPVHLISSQGRYNHFDTTPYLSQHDFSPAAEKPAQKKLRIWGEFVGRTTKIFNYIIPQKPATYKEFRAGGYRIATRISSRSRYDHFDTSP